MSRLRSRFAIAAALVAAGSLVVVGSTFAGPDLPTLGAPTAGVGVGNTSAGNLAPQGAALRVQAMLDAEGIAAGHSVKVPVDAAAASPLPATPSAPAAPALPASASNQAATGMASAPSAPQLPSAGSSSSPSTPNAAAMVPPGVTAAADTAKANATDAEAKAEPIAAKGLAALSGVQTPSAPSAPSSSASPPAQASLAANVMVSANGTTHSESQSIMIPPSSSSQ